MCHLKADWAYSLKIKDRTVKLVLAQLCDAWTEKDGCFPSVARIAKRVCASERTVQRTLKRLEILGAIVRKFTGRATHYSINFEWQPATPYVASEVSSSVTPDPTPSVTPRKKRRGDIPATGGDANVTSDPTSFGTLTQRTQLDELKEPYSPLPGNLFADAGVDGSGRSPSDCAVDEWNARAKQWGWPVAQKRDPKRMQAVAARLSDLHGLSGWEAMLAKAEASKFVREQMHNWSLDWVTNPTNLRKLMEGNYDDKRNAKPDTGLLAVLAALGPESAG